LEWDKGEGGGGGLEGGKEAEGKGHPVKSEMKGSQTLVINVKRRSGERPDTGRGERKG